MSEDRAENIQAPEEEQVLFHTHTVYTRETLLEMQKSAIKTVVILIAVLFAFAVPSAVATILEKNHYELVCFMVLIYGLCLACVVSIPYRVVKRQSRQYRSLYGGEVKVELYFGAETVTNVNVQTGGKLSVSYDKFVKIQKTKNLYVLYMKEKMVFLFRKDDFITGDAGSFERFIADRCPTAKRNFLRSKK